MKRYLSFVLVFVLFGFISVNTGKAMLVVPTYTATISSSPQVATPITLHVDPVAAVGGLDFVLSSSDLAAGWYFTNANSSSCTTTLATNTLHVNAGDSNKNFCYFDSIPGTYTLTATNSLSTTASQDITVADTTDTDGDGIYDSADNCPNVANPDQADANDNGVGDACEELTEDTVAPVVTLNAPIQGSTVETSDVPYSFTYTDETTEIIDCELYHNGQFAGNAEASSGVEYSGVYGGMENGLNSLLVKCTDEAGNVGTSNENSFTVAAPEIDTTDPTIISARSMSPNTVEVLFSEELQNDENGHSPQINDFDVRNGEVSYGIEGVSYENKKVTIILNKPILKGDSPVLYVFPALASLVDLAGNYFNGGEGYNMPVQVEKTTNTMSGARYIPKEEPTKIPGCGERRDGYSTVNGKSCINNIPHEEGWVLGAEKFVFTLLLKREQPPYSVGAYANEVLELQKFLNANGYDSGPEDGKFGPLTEAAVIKFQLANGLVGDGVVGPLTRAVLNR